MKRNKFAKPLNYNAKTKTQISNSAISSISPCDIKDTPLILRHTQGFPNDLGGIFKI
jgi:hypothetical protein